MLVKEAHVNMYIGLWDYAFCPSDKFLENCCDKHPLCLHSLELLSDYRMDGLVQETRNSIANELRLRFSCTDPSIWKQYGSMKVISCRG